MSLGCKLFGHKKNGCKCARCGMEMHVYTNYRCGSCGVPDKEGLRRIDREAVSRLTDLSILADVIGGHLIVPVRQAAIKRRTELVNALTDQSVLLGIVNSDGEHFADRRYGIRTDFRVIAVKKITDQKMLSEIIRHHKYPEVRFHALASLTDQAVLESIVRADDDRRLRETALRKLKSQATLAEIAKNGDDPSLRRIAVDKLTDPALIEEFARHDADNGVRKAAIGLISDEDILAEIAMGDDDSAIYLYALGRITDTGRVLSLARQAANAGVRYEAIRKLDGYFCTACKAENLPENGQPVACVCNSCHAENHEFKKMYNTTALPGRAEKNESYDMCVRCGITKNHEEEIRFTDW